MIKGSLLSGERETSGGCREWPTLSTSSGEVRVSGALWLFGSTSDSAEIIHMENIDMVNDNSARFHNLRVILTINTNEGFVGGF